MICVTMDTLTPCLVEVETGKIFQTEVVELKRKSYLATFNRNTGWYVNWSKFDEDARIFALVLAGTVEIQGLLAVRPNFDKDFMALHVLWACAAPHNNKWEYGTQKYSGVGGHLFAIAADISVQYGFGGAMYGEAADEDILNHYIKQFGAKRLPKTIHPFAMWIDEKSAARIKEEYDYVWSAEKI